MTDQLGLEDAPEQGTAVTVVDKQTGEVIPVTPPATSDPAGVAALALLSEDEFNRRLAVLDQGRRRVQAIKESLMTPNVDYGIIPGTGQKPTLLKPGAEKLAEFYRLAAEIVLHEKHGDGVQTPLIGYVAECRLHLGTTDGPVVAVGWGVCTNWEKKYRYRGSGSNRTEVTDPWEQANTIAKMAEKRGFVDAVLRATASSSLFTQDLEDLYADRQAQADTAPGGADNAPQRAAGGLAADPADGAYCPVHRKPWKQNRRGYYCSSKDDSTESGWCEQKPDRAWVASQELN